MVISSKFTQIPQLNHSFVKLFLVLGLRWTWVTRSHNLERDWFIWSWTCLEEPDLMGLS
jgi:hypothetical protein